MNFETYFMRVLTPMHVGTGTGLGYIDLPIYREAHTDFPAVPASTIKGVFRTEEIRKLSNGTNSAKDIEERLMDYDPEEDDEEKSIVRLFELFGNQRKEGNVVFTDARILYFPVKSLRGIFAYVTCPYVLKRFAEDAKQGYSGIEISDKNICKVFNSSDVVVFIDNEKYVVLEEFSLKAEEEKENMDIPTAAGLVDKRRVVIVHDDLFTYFVKTFTEIQTHIKVGIESGTVDKGALWTEEYVPAESILYFKVSKNQGFNIENGKRIQIGGGSSTGKGIVEVVKL